jgi:hypothetical protein
MGKQKEIYDGGAAVGQRWGSGGAASTQIDPSPSRKEHPSSFKAGGCDGFDVLGVGS